MSLALTPDGALAPVSPPSSHLDIFARWINGEDGQRFWQFFDTECRLALSVGRDRLPVWETLYSVKKDAQVKLDHDREPLIPRLWMLLHDRPDFFDTKPLSRYTEAEVEACLRGIIDGWRAGGRAQ